MSRKLLILSASLFLFSTNLFSANPRPETACTSFEELSTFFQNYTVQLTPGKVDNVGLYQEVYNWLHTKYRLGGSSEYGIDCANFVKMLYEKVYNSKIEGNAISLFNTVTPIDSYDGAAEGDLIFFKIKSKNISHVGIYLQHGMFAHASTHGVVVSSLDEPYYKKYFYKAGRVQVLYSEAH